MVPERHGKVLWCLIGVLLESRLDLYDQSVIYISSIGVVVTWKRRTVCCILSDKRRTISSKVCSTETQTHVAART